MVKAPGARPPEGSRRHDDRLTSDRARRPSRAAGRLRPVRALAAQDNGPPPRRTGARHAHRPRPCPIRLPARRLLTYRARHDGPAPVSPKGPAMHGPRTAEPIAAADLELAADQSDPRERRRYAIAGIAARRAELALYAALYAERNGGRELGLERLVSSDPLYARLNVLAGA